MKKNIEISPNIETLFGTRDENLRLLEDGLNVTIDLQSDSIEIEGAASDVGRAEQVFADYQHLLRNGFTFVNGDLGSMIRVLTADSTATLRGLAEAGKQRSFGKRTVQPKSINQRRYLEAIEKHDMVFGVGPAGTGKTYLAVAMAISALLSKRVNRIILARPAVEAGERLGFLPGTLQEKVDPYLRPLYDALYDMLEPDKVDRYLEKNIIEIAPIAFMRGRTLNDAFVILDEAQNTTSEQMKMFVTRLGFNSKAVITGDITQIDLPNANRSGLLEAMDILKQRGRNSLLLLRRGRRGAPSPGAAHHPRLRRLQGPQRAVVADAGSEERQRLRAGAQRQRTGVPGQRRNARCRWRKLLRRKRRLRRRIAFPSRDLLSWCGRACSALPFVLEKKVIVLEQQQPGSERRALSLFAAKARRALGLRGEVNVRITSSRELRELNRRFRRKDKPTDVLSFPSAMPKLAGDIAISAEIAAANAADTRPLAARRN